MATERFEVANTVRVKTCIEEMDFVMGNIFCV